MLTNHDIRSAHRVAVMASVDIVKNVTPEDLHRATPCDGWNLSDLLAHMTVQHHGFAAAARGGGADLVRWDAATVADAVATDPAGTYAAAAADVLRAFADDDVLDASFALPEFGPDVAVPGSQAIGFHFVDYVVHGWDVARAIGAPFTLPADVISAVLPLVLAVPDGDFRSAPSSPFAPAIEAGGDVGDLDRVLLHLGRCARLDSLGPPSACQPCRLVDTRSHPQADRVGLRLLHNTAVGRGPHRFEHPAVAEGVPDLGLADLGTETAARVGQCEHMHQPARQDRGMQAAHIPRAVGGVEDVEQRAVDDRLVAGLAEIHRVGHLEPRVDALGRRVGLGLFDRVG